MSSFPVDRRPGLTTAEHAGPLETQGREASTTEGNASGEPRSTVFPTGSRTEEQGLTEGGPGLGAGALCDAASASSSWTPNLPRISTSCTLVRFPLAIRITSSSWRRVSENEIEPEIDDMRARRDPCDVRAKYNSGVKGEERVGDRKEDAPCPTNYIARDHGRRPELEQTVPIPVKA